MLDKTPTSLSSLVIPSDNENLFLPIGGVGEIGMNMYLYGHDGHWIMVDCGIGFNNKNLPGIEILLPSVDVIANINISALFITHAHEDHIGAIAYLWQYLQCPIYCLPFCSYLITHKLLDQQLLDDAQPYINIINISDVVDIDGFSVEIIPMTHSIPEANALYITTKAGNIFHSGDWKLDDTPLIGQPPHYQRLQEIGNQGLDMLICDSTNATKAKHSDSEEKVAAGLESCISDCHDGRIFITCFASNVARICSILYAAKKAKRHVALAGRSLTRVFNAAVDSGIIDKTEILSIEEAMALPANESLIIVTGSQGEGRSTLSRIARQEHGVITLKAGDHVIYSSKDIPGNDNAIAKIKNMLAMQMVNIHDQAIDYVLHASGHPSQSELEKLYEFLKPKRLIPIHGEARHLLAHCHFADQQGIKHVEMVANGDICRISDDKLPTIGQIDCLGQAIDGKIITPLQSPAIKKRIRIAWNGIVFICLIENIYGLELAYLSLHGIPIDEEQSEELHQQTEDFIASFSEDELAKELFVSQSVSGFVKKFIKKYCGKTPIMDINIVRGTDHD